MTLQEIQHKAQSIIHKWRDDDSAPYIEFVDELAHMIVPEPSADLEEAADEYAEKHGFRVPYDGSDNFYDDVDVKASKEGFIAGYKYHANHVPLPEDLEEAAWDCVLDSVDVNNPVLLPKYKELLTYLFIAGAKWQAEKCDEETSKLLYAERQTAYINGWHDCKEQMMEQAVEGEVCIPNSWLEPKEGKELVVRAEISKELGFKFGDKVRLIIVKED